MVQRSPLFQFAVSRGPRVSVQCIAVKTGILLAVYKENTRPVGRPRARWADVVQRDVITSAGVKRMEEKS